MDGGDSRKLGIACGAVEYMVKPFDPVRLMAVIRKYAKGSVSGELRHDSTRQGGKGTDRK
jgi:DNA-binding response OmpR family regulator